MTVDLSTIGANKKQTVLSPANSWAIISLAVFYRNMKCPTAHRSEHQTSWFILMNYIKHDAAPLGQFKRIFCMIPCSHPFMIRHELLTKNQWRRSLPTYVRVFAFVFVFSFNLTGPGWGYTPALLRAVAPFAFALRPANKQHVTWTCYLPDCCCSLTLHWSETRKKRVVFFEKCFSLLKRDKIAHLSGIRPSSY